MTPDQIAQANAELRGKSPLEITRWAITQSRGRAVVSTNFRPYEAVILHLATQVEPDIPVLWADHGYNRPATYKHAEQLRALLKLNLKVYVPKMTAAHRDAIHGPIPTPDDEAALKEFSAGFKLEPFARGMKELAPTIWLTALRKVQNPNRAGLDIVSGDQNFGTIKVSPVFYLTDADMESYLKQHNLPNEWDYFDPAKADEKRECGLHAAWGGEKVEGLKRFRQHDFAVSGDLSKNHETNTASKLQAACSATEGGVQDVRGLGGLQVVARISESCVCCGAPLAGLGEVRTGRPDSAGCGFSYQQHCGGTRAISLLGANQVLADFSRLSRRTDR